MFFTYKHRIEECRNSIFSYLVFCITRVFSHVDPLQLSDFKISALQNLKTRLNIHWASPSSEKYNLVLMQSSLTWYLPWIENRERFGPFGHPWWPKRSLPFHEPCTGSSHHFPSFAWRLGPRCWFWELLAGIQSSYPLY